VATHNGRFYFYDPAANSWAPDSMVAPAGFVDAVVAGGAPYAVVRENGGVAVYKLSAIQ
jgi:hypothetical protein